MKIGPIKLLYLIWPSFSLAYFITAINIITITKNIIIINTVITINYYFPEIKLSYGTKYSRMDQVKFVEDSL